MNLSCPAQATLTALVRADGVHASADSLLALAPGDARRRAGDALRGRFFVPAGLDALQLPLPQSLSENSLLLLLARGGDGDSPTLDDASRSSGGEGPGYEL